jgi:hypothetical protein
MTPDDLDHLRKLARRIPRARRRMIDAAIWCGTGPNPAGGGSRGSGHSDRTSALAVAAATTTDTATTDRHDLDALVDTIKRRTKAGAPITNEINRLTRLVDRWDHTPATDRLVRSMAAPAGGADGCKSCARYTPEGRPTFSDVHARGLCRYCIRARNRTAGRYEWDGELPPVALVEHHHRTGRNLTDEVIDRAMRGTRRRA